MAARSPRRTFASPFVVTLAVAVPGTACHTSNPPVASSIVEGPAGGQETTAPAAEPDPPPPPPPPAAPASPTALRQWTVVMSGGRCEAHVEIACPPDTRCNPPRPKAYECPPGMTEGDHVTVKMADGQDTCFVQPEPVSCPPGVICNPPPPQKVDCPQ